MKIYFAAHDLEKSKLGKGVYVKLAKMFFRDRFRNGANLERYDELRTQAFKDLLEAVDEEDTKTGLCYQYDIKHRNEIDSLYQEYKSTEYVRYLIVNEKTAITCVLMSKM